MAVDCHEADGLGMDNGRLPCEKHNQIWAIKIESINLGNKNRKYTNSYSVEVGAQYQSHLPSLKRSVWYSTLCWVVFDIHYDGF